MNVHQRIFGFIIYLTLVLVLFTLFLFCSLAVKPHLPEVSLALAFITTKVTNIFDMVLINDGLPSPNGKF